MTAFKFEMMHINDVKPGYCIEENGQFVTLSKNSIKDCPFIGRTIRGDNYKNGTVLVKVCLFPSYDNGKFTGYSYWLQKDCLKCKI